MIVKASQRELLLRPPDSCRVYTPPAVADAMVQALGDAPNDLWLEPCAGGGVFLEALSRMQVSVARIRAVDLDATPGPFDGLARTLRGMEFLGWAKTTRERFTKVVANPPYLALHKLPLSIRQVACSFRSLGDHEVALRANSWYAFLCASLSILRPEGSICVLLPAGWDYANYASHLRKEISSHFADFEVHRSQQPLFPGVQEGSVVVLARGFRQPSRCVLRAEYSSATSFIDGVAARARSHVRRLTEPMRLVASGGVSSRTHSSEPRLVRLGDVIDIQLGGVTGDVAYFLLTEQERRKRGLPRDSVKPVVTHAHHLRAASMGSRQWRSLRDSGERVWLFRPSSARARASRIRSYLELSLEKGGCNRSAYKVKSRKPWYRTPLPDRVDGFISGMSRRGPWVCLKAMMGLSATNTLYVVRYPRNWSNDRKAVWALSLLTTKAGAALEHIGRKYADGLLKFEPGDLANLQVSPPTRVKGALREYHQAVAALLAGEISECRRIADQWFIGEGSAGAQQGVHTHSTGPRNEGSSVATLAGRARVLLAVPSPLGF
jgi:adenine-specific DNA-methyltransferase